MTTKFDEKRREYADSPEMLAMIDRDERREANYPKVTPPCPSWCRSVEIYGARQLATYDHPHGYDSLSDDETTFFRFHVSSNEHYYVAQEEQNREGVITLGPLHLGGGPEEEMTAAQARAKAAELLAAADMLDEVTAVGE
jgi:hypothetical protein